MLSGQIWNPPGYFPIASLLQWRLQQPKLLIILAANALTGTNAEKFKQIHTQFYLAHYMYLDFFEAWSNWRRTGYPDILTPINYVTEFNRWCYNQTSFIFLR